MIEGIVFDRAFAVVPLDIKHPKGQQTQLEVLIDTGFTGELTLTSEFIENLDLQCVGARTAELANGVFVETDLFAATCTWHGQDRKITVMRIDAQPLIGMEMLQKCRLTIDVKDDGLVRIQPLNEAQSSAN
jgi:clan AA aspartic protease